ncbi:palmitoyl-protein hydrolase [Balamuthia mandrillaris]
MNGFRRAAASSTQHVRTSRGSFCLRSSAGRRRHSSSASSSSTILTIPSAADHRATLIFLHGLGDTGQGWFDPLYYLSRQLQHFRIVLPTAPVRPITLNGGMRMPGWYDIKDLSGDRQDLEDYEGLSQTKEFVLGLVEKELEQGNGGGNPTQQQQQPLTEQNIFLGGFSQGAASALHTAYYCGKYRLGGVIALSGYLPFASQCAQMVVGRSKEIPLLMCHGLEDEVVLYEWGQQSFAQLKKAGVNGTFRTYEGLGHSCCDQELIDMQRFLLDNTNVQKS